MSFQLRGFDYDQTENYFVDISSIGELLQSVADNSSETKFWIRSSLVSVALKDSATWTIQSGGTYNTVSGDADEITITESAGRYVPTPITPGAGFPGLRTSVANIGQFVDDIMAGYICTDACEIWVDQTSDELYITRTDAAAFLASGGDQVAIIVGAASSTDFME